MDYERIQKPHSQGGGVSPSKLRLMLLGVEKRRKEDDELESKFALRSTAAGGGVGDAGELEDRNERGGSAEDRSPDSVKDVDVVSSPPECSTSSEMGGGHRNKSHAFANSRGLRSQEEDCGDSDSMPSSAVFEFQRAERASLRSAVVPPFSKPAPSKWDDAQKWIASPTTNRTGKGGGAQVKRTGGVSCGNRMAATKVVVEVMAEPDTKRIDHSQTRKEGGESKSTNWVPDAQSMADSCTKSAVFVETSIADAAINLSQHDSSTSAQSATAYIHPPSTVRSVSMRDMGTEMTPIASQEPSRSGTPLRASSPIRSPALSPGRIAPTSTPVEYSDHRGDPNRKVLSEKELQMKTRREIMILGTKLGKPNIAAWASREEEEQDASKSLKNVPVDAAEKNAIGIRASAWEEAEKAKYLARFKREEMKIQAWENHQKAKAEAEMRKVEVEVERTKAYGHEKLKNKLAELRQKAEEKRMAAEVKRNRQAARTAEQVEYIRRTGRMPSCFSCWGCCS